MPGSSAPTAMKMLPRKRVRPLSTAKYWIAAQQGADDIPDLGVPFAPAENRIDAFGERAGPEGGYAQRPPQQIWRFSGQIMRYDPAEKEHRKNRGQNGYIIDHISSPGSRPASRTAFAFITPWATLRSMTSVALRRCEVSQGSDSGLERCEIGPQQVERRQR